MVTNEIQDRRWQQGQLGGERGGELQGICQSALSQKSGGLTQLACLKFRREALLLIPGSPTDTR